MKYLFWACPLLLLMFLLVSDPHQDVQAGKSSRPKRKVRLVTNVRGISSGAGVPLIRISPASDDGFEGVNPRTISNLVCSQTASITNNHGLSDAIWAWGQFVDHDIDLTESNSDNGTANIFVEDLDDPLYPIIPFNRSNYVEINGQREQINEITPFIDASNVYGSDEFLAELLRDEGGRMESENGLLPFDGFAFVAGDIRANEHVVLTSLHTLFVREHNRLAKRISRMVPGASDEEIYQLARKIVGAELQVITYKEFLPALLGDYAPRPDDYHFNSNIDPTIANEFSGALYRVGHTMLSGNLIIDGVGVLPLRNAFFNPEFLRDDPQNVQRMLMGLKQQPHQEIDCLLVEDVRSFLFGAPGAGGLDLATLNIQRGRDHDLPDYNTVRISYGLPPVASFFEITSDPGTLAALEDIYESVDDIDLWIGALAEDHVPGTSVGPLVLVGMVDQFTRLRDGDPFFYVGDPDLHNKIARRVIDLNQVTFGWVVERNTDARNVGDLFRVKPPENVPEKKRPKKRGRKPRRR
ncbi:MAG: peroxiredoxin [Planctomycetaceae bacterium]|nr:peroxiredoxin [Planctomycetaceae bacterium]